MLYAMELSVAGRLDFFTEVLQGVKRNMKQEQPFHISHFITTPPPPLL